MTQAKKPVGRPSKYSEALVAEICARLSNGEPLAVICREEGMPDTSTIFDWQKARTDVSQAIARAREAGEERILADCLEIADDGRNDYMQKLADGGDERAVQLNSEHVQRSKLRVDTRLKLLAKWNPKKWGELLKQEVSGPGGGAIPVSTVDASKLSDATLNELLNARTASKPFGE